MEQFRRLAKRFRRYIYDQSINVKDRSFILYSVLVLFALFVAVPCGLIMHEPLSATIATLLGAITFSIYIYYSFKRNQIEHAKMVLSLVVVFIFLPAMFFTNGGVYGGTPVWLLLGMIYITLILDGRVRTFMLAINVCVTAICWTIGYYFPNLIMEYSREGNFFDSVTAIYIVGGIIYTLLSFQLSLIRKDEEGKNQKRLFEQTAIALVNAIDAKDKYTHGHSSRVADYSKRIAEMSGMSPAECDEIYYVALLHDVGKIGVPENIINKKGKLTDEERKIIEQHPVLGSQILRSITEYPNLIIGARHHHERYDGKGYPDRLKGEDIPVYARIIAVADAYDAMTSKRSYRYPIPQQTVREEILEGAGTQFDPKFTKIMQHLIDIDTEYEMREKDNNQELEGISDVISNFDKEEVSEGIHLVPEIKRIRLKCDAADPDMGGFNPSIVLFDSLDERYHDSQREIKDLNYFEYAQLWFDGGYRCEGARKIEVEIKDRGTISRPEDHMVYDIEAVRIKDHVQIVIDNMVKTVTFIIAMPDKARFSYIGFTGENCHFHETTINTSYKAAPDEYIRRIAEEISYINVPAGDIPNVEVDGYRTDSTLGIPITDGMKVTFHTLSLPTARLVWHCAYLDIFHSPDKKPEGDEFKEYALIRLDGEHWEARDISENKSTVNFGDDFEGWEKWKEANKQGFECTINFKVEGNKITTTTDNMGISIKVVTTIYDMPEEVYFSLTGDQCALTNIRIEK